MRARDERTVLTQRDADRRLGERLHDVTFWRSELQVIIFISYLNRYVIHFINTKIKTFTENWVGKQSFFVLILTTA
jgi:hypothetical protein